MPDVYSISIDTVADVPESILRNRMPLRWERAQKYRLTSDKMRCLGAGILLSAVLGVDEKSIEYGANGKPFVRGDMQFNISHGGMYAILAVGNEPLGVDIEPIEAENLSIAPEVLRPDELAWMRQQPLERFHALWTLKESAMKATGLGFAMPPRSFSVLPVESNLPHPYAGKQWYARWLSYRGCALAVCAARPIGEIRVRELRDVCFFIEGGGIRYV